MDATALNALKDAIPDYARDVRVNLGNVLAENGSPGLTDKQAWATAIACAFATGSTRLVDGLVTAAGARLEPVDLEGARSAAAIMAMNNVYYRTMHLLGDAEVSGIPAGLRMQVISKPPVSKLDFELMSFAVSAIGGCEDCLKAHAKVLKHGGVSAQALHSAIRLASVLKAAGAALP